MKLQDVAEKYCIDAKDFEKYIKESGLPCDRTESDLYIGIYEINVPDAYVDDYVNAFWDYLDEKRQEEEEERQRLEAEHAEMLKATSRMLISSGFSFDGYKIVKYSGYISGDDAARVESTWILSSDQVITDKITGLLVKLRRKALQELKEAAYDLGCNAVVGVDFDYLTLEPKQFAITTSDSKAVFVAVTANGNAVLIEKEDD